MKTGCGMSGVEGELMRKTTEKGHGENWLARGGGVVRAP